VAQKLFNARLRKEGNAWIACIILLAGLLKKLWLDFYQIWEGLQLGTWNSQLDFGNHQHFMVCTSLLIFAGIRRAKTVQDN